MDRLRKNSWQVHGDFYLYRNPYVLPACCRHLADDAKGKSKNRWFWTDRKAGLRLRRTKSVSQQWNQEATTSPPSPMEPCLLLRSSRLIATVTCLWTPHTFGSVHVPQIICSWARFTGFNTVTLSSGSFVSHGVSIITDPGGQASCPLR